MANMGICYQEMLAALIADSSVTTFHDYSVRFLIKADTAFFRSNANTHASYWIIIKLCLFSEILHFNMALLIFSLAFFDTAILFIFKLSIVHWNKLSVMFFILKDFILFFSLSLIVIELKKFIAWIILNNFRLLSEMTWLFSPFFHPLRWISERKLFQVTFKIWIRFIPLVSSTNFGLFQILYKVPLQYFLFLFLLALLEIRSCKFFLWRITIENNEITMNWGVLNL